MKGDIRELSRSPLPSEARFTFEHIQKAGTWSGRLPDDTTAITGEVFIGRGGKRRQERALTGPKGMPNGQRLRLAEEARKAKAILDAMPVVRDKRIDNPVLHPPKTVMVDRPKPHGPQPYDVYVRGMRAGTVKLRSYTGTK